jgi:shikimate dehydrogenase
VRTRLGVLGWPVAHSRSPAIHNAALAAAGLEGWRYQHLPVPPELLGATTAALGPAGFRGANVTIPHKAAALALADQASDSARAIGAANTLSFEEDGRIEAENTDAPGFLAALPRTAAGQRALVLGAGGSARAVVWALVQAGASEVSVWNRTRARAAALAEDLGARVVASREPADLLVNCTSVGLEDSSSGPEALKSLGLARDDLDDYACVVDLVYRDRPTALVSTARQRGAQVVDGLEVLVQQGALSFRWWTGREAALDVMRAAAAGAGAWPRSLQ